MLYALLIPNSYGQLGFIYFTFAFLILKGHHGTILIIIVQSVNVFTARTGNLFQSRAFFPHELLEAQAMDFYCCKSFFLSYKVHHCF